MQYKTIVLNLLKQQPDYARLRHERKLLPTLVHHAAELKSLHEAWMRRLRHAQPNSDPSQISSEALELALEELKSHLFSGTPPPDQTEPLSLDGAMAFIRKHTPTE